MMASVLPSTSAIRHGRRRACSGEPPSQLSLAVDARGWGEYSGEDATAGDLTVGEFLPVSAVLSFGLADEWVPVDRGPQLPVGYDLIFWIYFTNLNACFKNSYLKLGVSNFGEPNFVSFILKCIIW